MKPKTFLVRFLAIYRTIQRKTHILDYDTRIASTNRRIPDKDSDPIQHLRILFYETGHSLLSPSTLRSSRSSALKGGKLNDKEVIKFCIVPETVGGARAPESTYRKPQVSKQQSNVPRDISFEGENFPPVLSWGINKRAFHA